MSRTKTYEKRARRADLDKIREYGIFCTRDLKTVVVNLPDNKKVFFSVDTKRKEPCQKIYTAEESLQW